MAPSPNLNVPSVVLSWLLGSLEGALSITGFYPTKKICFFIFSAVCPTFQVKQLADKANRMLNGKSH